MQDWVLYFVIGTIALTVIILLMVVPAVHFGRKPPKQLDDVYVGMPEEELLDTLGKPRQIVQVDEVTKMYLYTQVDRGGFLLWSYYKDFQIILKYCEVANVSYHKLKYTR